MARFDGEVMFPFAEDERGSPRWITDVIALSPKQRPVLHCQGCQQEVIVHAEPLPHATHADPAEGGRCTPPLGALFRETAKLRLRDELRKVKVLKSVRFCAACHGRQEFEVARDWDAVEAERPFGTGAADIIATRDGQPVLALEVFASRELSAAKLAELEQRGLPWIQVKPVEVLEPLWRGVDPLRAERIHGPGWICTGCLKKHTAEETARDNAPAFPLADDELLDEGRLSVGGRTSYYRSALPRARYAQAGTMPLPSAASMVQPWQEDFTHVGLERIVELDVGGELVRVVFGIGVWSTAAARDVLALTYRMMEGEQLSNPRPLAYEPLLAAAKPENWLELMARAQRALAPSGQVEPTVTFDQGWKVEREGCDC
ncbi:MAG TPA: hypothetical protein VK447_09425, partial [Myxococcaceae bacterium]|nr:hypothetical protein [Myxococcaceae bacterium]